MGLTYLASPYTHPDSNMREVRFHAACKAAAILMREGPVFSPIAHSHAVEEHGMEQGQTSHCFWMDQDIAILRHCDKLVVLCIDGWNRSRGVTEEIRIAQRLGIKVEYMHP